mmetsp:Transcript_18991/g.52278  ORF Transcript_18991/g.52278 Transcript_18991/m.52278 type:complete len:293 (+) Transcript_18991:602-1480(+)
MPDRQRFPRRISLPNTSTSLSTRMGRRFAKKRIIESLASMGRIPEPSMLSRMKLSTIPLLLSRLLAWPSLFQESRLRILPASANSWTLRRLWTGAARRECSSSRFSPSTTQGRTPRPTPRRRPSRCTPATSARSLSASTTRRSSASTWPAPRAGRARSWTSSTATGRSTTLGLWTRSARSPTPFSTLSARRKCWPTPSSRSGSRRASRGSRPTPRSRCSSRRRRASTTNGSTPPPGASVRRRRRRSPTRRAATSTWWPGPTSCSTTFTSSCWRRPSTPSSTAWRSRATSPSA